MAAHFLWRTKSDDRIFVIGKDLEDILRSLPRRIEQSLRYDVLDILPQFEADLSLEYLWRNSLSSWVDTSKNQIRVGDRLLVVGSSGQAEALVAVSDLVVTDGRTTAVFDPLYRRAPQPGLAIVSGPAGAVPSESPSLRICRDSDLIFPYPRLPPGILGRHC
jgi:hypothetical protein